MSLRVHDEEGHLTLLKMIQVTTNAMTLAQGAGRTGSCLEQDPLRALETTVRRRVVVFCRWLRSHRSYGWKDVSECLGIALRTLRRWVTDRAAALQGQIRRLGRPTFVPDAETRSRVFAMLWSDGHTTQEELQSHFATLTRKACQELKACFRRVVARLAEAGRSVLDWLVPNTVWTMDYANPPIPIEGKFEKILIMADLASRNKLLAEPQPCESDECVVQELRRLFAQHGRPLVLKSDNGSSFKSRVVQDFLKKERVTWLPSPPRYPEYNGACEAGVGSIKVRAERHAAQDGRPGDWTCDDVEWARQDANENGRPRGVNRLTPNEAFAGRKEVSEEERDSFRSLVRAYYEREVELRGVKDVDALNREKHLMIIASQLPELC